MTSRGDLLQSIGGRLSLREMTQSLREDSGARDQRGEPRQGNQATSI
jgi:hypothetical protein